jgi:Tol biopolymer transport system component
MRRHRNMHRKLLVSVFSITVLSLGVPGFAVTPTTRRISVSSAESQGDYHSWSSLGGAVSSDGRFVVFTSPATGLVPGDTAGTFDVFLRDRQRGITRLVSVNSAEVKANAASGPVSISADGRFIVFDSVASNLVGNDTNGQLDIFLRDRTKGITRRISVNSAEVQGNAGSYDASISPDGRFVVFSSDAANLVGNDTNAVGDVFIRDRMHGTTRRISLNSAEVEGNASSVGGRISADGRLVVFRSLAANLVAGDTNAVLDVFLRDRGTGRTRRLSMSSAGVQANDESDDPRISGDGRFVVFESNATNLVPGDVNGTWDVFIRNLAARRTKLVSVNSAELRGNGASLDAGISAAGRYVVFSSGSTNLVGADTNGSNDIFVRDRRGGTTRRVSLTVGGAESNGPNSTPSISSNGRFVVWVSASTNLVSGDTNGYDDVFIRGPLR